MQSPIANRLSPLAVLLVLAALAPAGRAGEKEPAASAPSLPDVRAIVRERGNAVVRVETFEYYLPGLVRRTGRLLNPFPLRRTLGDAFSLTLFVPSCVFYPLRKHLGSGVLIDAEGHLLTNYHVVRNADRFTVRLTDAEGVRRRFHAKLLGIDPQTDIALLKIAPGKTPLVVAPLGEPDQLELGDWIVAIGNPINLTGSVTAGIVSGLHRQLGSNPIEDYIQVSAALNPGNSGGPILNTRGEVVGIVALGVFPANNIGFAIPTTLISPYLDDLKHHGQPRRGYLGITVRDITPDLAKDRELDTASGVLVTDVSIFSPAEEAGIKTGDVLVAYDGKELAKARDVQMAVLRTRPGAAVPIVLRRDGERLELQAEVSRRRTPFRVF